MRGLTVFIYYNHRNLSLHLHFVIMTIGDEFLLCLFKLDLIVGEMYSIGLNREVLTQSTIALCYQSFSIWSLWENT